MDWLSGLSLWQPVLFLLPHDALSSPGAADDTVDWFGFVTRISGFMFGFVTITRHKGQAKRQKGQSGGRKRGYYIFLLSEFCHSMEKHYLCTNNSTNYILISAALYFNVFYKYLSNKKLLRILPCQKFHLS